MTVTGTTHIIIADIADLQDDKDRDLSNDVSKNRMVVGHAFVRTLEDSHTPLLELRVFVPSRDANELLAGVVRGDTAIVIGQVLPGSPPN